MEQAPLQHFNMLFAVFTSETLAVVEINKSDYMNCSKIWTTNRICVQKEY